MPKPQFLPMYLVRVSDMVVVRGSEVNEGYCALSYSWNQSGKFIRDEHTGRPIRTDQGKHEIVFPRRMIRKKPRGRRCVASKTKLVKFEGLIQQICKDFGIRYIWYNQMCINQKDQDEKVHEIQKMHTIYPNASFMIALIPELQYDANRNNSKVKMASISALSNSEWSKTVWTVEEAFMAREIVFVGRNVHMWSNVVSQHTAIGTREIPFLQPLCDKSVKWTANTILFHAHTRRCTKDHDHVFALANMLPDIKNQITVNYKQDIAELMTHFYGLLMKSDLSILCFSAHLYYQRNLQQPQSEAQSLLSGVKSIDISKAYKSPMEQYGIPSWSGVSGEHIPGIYLKIPFQKFSIDGRCMTVTSPSIPVTIGKRFSRFESNLDGFAAAHTPIWTMDKRRLLLIDLSSSDKSVPFIATRKNKVIGVRHEFFGEYDIKVTHILPVQEIEETDKVCITPNIVRATVFIIYGWISITDRRGLYKL